jgi:hypothetical protein
MEITELNIDRVKKLKGELLEKFDFVGTCSGCGKKNYFSSVEISGLLVYVPCDCGNTNTYRITENGEGQYKIRESTLDVYNTVLEIFQEYGHPLTVRQVFYQLSSRNKVDKSEKGYRQTANHLKEMRFKGVIPFGYFADNSRYQIKPDSYGNMYDFLNTMQDYYRRDFWNSQNVYIEIWVEKDALRSVFAPVTKKYDVPLMVAKGYSSLTFLYEAAENIKYQQKNGKQVYIYQFGDHDPSGVNAGEKIHETLRLLCDGIIYERIALTPEQITKYNLQTRPTKKSDTRSKGFNDESCELDALPPDVLRGLIRNCIEQHINPDDLQKHEAIEVAELETLNIFRRNFN